MKPDIFLKKKLKYFFELHENKTHHLFFISYLSITLNSTKHKQIIIFFFNMATDILRQYPIHERPEVDKYFVLSLFVILTLLSTQS